MAAEFGAGYAGSLARDVALTPLGSMTAQEALAAGTTPRRVWDAVCEVMDIPRSRRFGPDRTVPRPG